MMVRAGLVRASAAAYAQAEADGRNDETCLWDKEIYRDGGADGDRLGTAVGNTNNSER
jgi:hypothetical protein